MERNGRKEKLKKQNKSQKQKKKFSFRISRNTVIK